MRSLFAATGFAALALTGCAQLSVNRAPQPGLMDVIERPAERALLAGMRAYDDAQYADAEKQLNAALKTGLASPKDQAAANKMLAFVYCTSNRVTDCEGAFRAARKADVGFALSKSEAGHPVWGAVYRRVLP